MPLTVEDGTIVADADSYVALDSYQAYAASRGWSLSGADATDEVNLRRAFDAVNRLWAYLGDKKDEDQIGAFPRDQFDDIPRDVQNAQMELAFLIQGGLDPFETISGVIKSAGAGPSRVEFVGGQGKLRLVAVEGLLRPYTGRGANQARVVRG